MPCTQPPALIVDSIADSLNEPGTTLTGAVYVEVGTGREDQRFSPSHFLAEHIIGGEIEDGVPGLWAVGVTGGQSILAVNSAAREYSDWGAAARFDSKMAEIRNKLLEYPEAVEALECLQRNQR